MSQKAASLISQYEDIPTDLSKHVELRAPINPYERAGEFMRLPPGSDQPKLSSKAGGYYRAAAPNTVAIWLGKSSYGDTPGAGVVSDRAIGSIGINWLARIANKLSKERASCVVASLLERTENAATKSKPAPHPARPGCG